MMMMRHHPPTEPRIPIPPIADINRRNLHATRPRLRPGRRPQRPYLPNPSTHPSIHPDNERFRQRKPGRDCKRNVA